MDEDLNAAPESVATDEVVDDIASSALPDETIESAGSEGEEGAQPAAPAAPASTAVGGGQPAPAPGNLDPNATPAPDTLKGEIKELWNKGLISPEVKAEIIRREQDFRNGMDQMRGPAELGQGYAKVIEPYAQVYQRYGVNPVEHTENLLKYHAVLMFGTPQQKAEILIGLARDSGMDLRALAQGQLQGLPESLLVRQIAEMRGQLQNMGSRFNAQDAAAMEKEIMNLANDVENYPHFWELAPAMIQELNANPRLSIEAAYRSSLAANPALFETVATAKAQKIAAKAQAEAQERARKAAKARGVNLSSSSGVRPASGKQSGGEFDLDAAIKESLDEINSR